MKDFVDLRLTGYSAWRNGQGLSFPLSSFYQSDAREDSLPQKLSAPCSVTVWHITINKKMSQVDETAFNRGGKFYVGTSTQ